MIDLTPLDVRKKRGDFAKGLRGYDPKEVDHFLEMVAERLEAVVKENMSLREQVDRLLERVQGQEGREDAVRNALVTAQELRKEIEEQAHREAELIRREARADAGRILQEAERTVQDLRKELLELNRTRDRFLRSFRTMLERQLDAVQVEEEAPRPVGFDLDALREAAGRAEPDRIPPRKRAPEPAHPPAEEGSSPPAGEPEAPSLEVLLGDEGDEGAEGHEGEEAGRDLFSSTPGGEEDPGGPQAPGGEAEVASPAKGEPELPRGEDS